MRAALLTILIILSNTLIYSQDNKIRCGTSKVPVNSAAITELISYPREVIEIPVVFHIVYSSEEENISDEVIMSQLEVINNDYNKKSPLTKSLPAKFDKKVATPGITFCLASIRPTADASSGIIRINTRIENIADQVNKVDGERMIKDTELGGSSPWNPERYLNVWIGSRSDGITGDATFPDDPEETETDGIVLDYQVVGLRPNDDGPFNLGKTLTHEIAHYLNVFHPYGSETGCFNDDDLVADTPNQFGPYFGKCDEDASSCGSRDMDTNFMNFRDDECLFFFTRGQVDRMIQTLFTTRYELISSNTCSGSQKPIPPDPLKVAPILSLQNGIEIPLTTLTEQSYTLALYDMAGKKVWKSNSNPEHRYMIDNIGLPSSIYVLVLQLENQLYSRKILMNQN